MRWRLFGSLGLAAALAMPSVATAQQVRAGAEFKANTYTLNVQRRADVHIKANGDFIVAWAGFGARGTCERGRRVTSPGGGGARARGGGANTGSSGSASMWRARRRAPSSGST